MLMTVMCFRPDATEVVITVTGTVNGVRDDLRIFGKERGVPKGTPYTLVFTFNDTKGQPMTPPCPGDGSGITGVGRESPSTAIITINDKSYEFGRRPDVRSRAWRWISSLCTDSEIGAAVEEGERDLVSGVHIKIRPNRGETTITHSLFGVLGTIRLKR
jgi:hypothetical protein